MQQFPADGINQPIFQDRGFVLSAKIHLKKCVVPALGPENRANLLGVQRQCEGRAFAAIQDRRHLACLPEPSGFILAAQGAGRTFHYNLLCHVLLPLLNSKWDKHSGLSSCSHFPADRQECPSHKIK